MTIQRYRQHWAQHIVQKNKIEQQHETTNKTLLVNTGAREGKTHGKDILYCRGKKKDSLSFE